MSKTKPESLIKKYWRITLGVVILVVFLYGIISHIISTFISSPTAKHIDLSPVFISSDYKDVSFKASDGLTLKGWLFNPKANKFVIFVPGILDNRTNGGYYGADLTKELIAKDVGVLLYDPRARGNSTGVTRLQNESNDVIGAVNFLESKNVSSKNIYVLAYSTGSRATLLALPNIKGVGGIIVDSTPTDFKSVLNHIVTVEQHLPGFILPGVFFWLNHDGVTLDSKDILNNVSNTKIPLLILQAKNDTSVPLENSKELNKADPKSKLVVFPNGSHIETYKFNPNLYRTTLFKFLGVENK